MVLVQGAREHPHRLLVRCALARKFVHAVTTPVRIIGLCLVDGVIDSDAVGRLVGAHNQPLRNIRVSIADAQMRDTLLTAQKGNRYVRVELELITSYGNTFTMNRSTERMPTYLVVSAVLEEIVPCAQLALTFQK